MCPLLPYLQRSYSWSECFVIPSSEINDRSPCTNSLRFIRNTNWSLCFGTLRRRRSVCPICCRECRTLLLGGRQDMFPPTAEMPWLHADLTLMTFLVTLGTFSSDPRQRKTINTEKSKTATVHEFWHLICCVLKPSSKWLLGRIRSLLQRIKRNSDFPTKIANLQKPRFVYFFVICTTILLLIKFIQILSDKIFAMTSFAIIYHRHNWRTLHPLYFSRTVICSPNTIEIIIHTNNQEAPGVHL